MRLFRFALRLALRILYDVAAFMALSLLFVFIAVVAALVCGII